MKNTHIQLSLICILVMLLCAALFLVPQSFMHDYYLLAANYWSDGLIPWLGFNLAEMPFGIKILSLIPDIELNYNFAVLTVLIFHLINTALLFSFMQKIGIEKEYALNGIIIYLSMLLGVSDFGISLEPFATFFLILSFWGIISHKIAKNIIAAILLVIAAMIKIQILLYIPVLALLILLPTYRHRVHSKRTFFFILIFTFCFLLGYMGITTWSENAEWITSVRCGFSTKEISDWILMICNSGFLFLAANQLKKQNIKGLGKNLVTCAWLGTSIMALSVIMACDITSIQLLLPVNVIAITYCLQQEKEGFAKKTYYFCIALALLAGTLKIIDRYQTEMGNNPLLETFDINYQRQQEVKNPIQGDVNIIIQD